MPDINDKYVIYYAVRGYRTGQTVTIDIYDTVGTKEVDSQSMTEMESTGIHTFNFRPRKRTSYVAVMDCSAFARKAHQVVRVEKQKLGGAVRIQRVKVPDTIWVEKDKARLFSLIKNIPSKFPKPQKVEEKKINIEELFSSLKTDILSKIPKPQKIPKEMFEGILDKYSDSLDARFKPIGEELNKLILLSDDINVNQKNVEAKPNLSPEKDMALLEDKYGTS